MMGNSVTNPSEHRVAPRKKQFAHSFLLEKQTPGDTHALYHGGCRSVNADLRPYDVHSSGTSSRWRYSIWYEIVRTMNVCLASSPRTILIVMHLVYLDCRDSCCRLPKSSLRRWGIAKLVNTTPIGQGRSRVCTKTDSSICRWRYSGSIKNTTPTTTISGMGRSIASIRHSQQNTTCQYSNPRIQRQGRRAVIHAYSALLPCGKYMAQCVDRCTSTRSYGADGSLHVRGLLHISDLSLHVVTQWKMMVSNIAALSSGDRCLLCI